MAGLDVCIGGAPIAHHIHSLSQKTALTVIPPKHYPCQMQAATASPPGYRINSLSKVIGHGREAYERASSALETAEAFELPWVRFWRRGNGRRWARRDVVVVAARVFPLVWSANVNEVVTVTRQPNRMAVAWGTTARHALRGEESIEVLHERNGDVRFRLRTFSRPNVLVAWLTYPLVLYLQHAFAADVCRKLSSIANDSLHSSPQLPHPVERGKPKQDNLRGARRLRIQS